MAAPTDHLGREEGQHSTFLLGENSGMAALLVSLGVQSRILRPLGSTFTRIDYSVFILYSVSLLACWSKSLYICVSFYIRFPLYYREFFMFTLSIY